MTTESDDRPPPFTPTVAPDHVEQIRRWHERAYRAGLHEGSSAQTFGYLGMRIVVPPQVMPIAGTSHLLGEAVLAEARPGERVLDMGTGRGVNAVLAAIAGAHVLAVDVNPLAVDAAKANVALNGVSGRVEVHHSDVFSEVRDAFGLIVFGPPFRWFRPCDLFEMAMADEHYRSLTRFFREARQHLSPAGRILVFFGTSETFGKSSTSPSG